MGRYHWVLFLLIIWPGYLVTAEVADESHGDFLIPGTCMCITALFEELAWDFSVERSEESEHLTLDWDGEGTTAILGINFQMKSTESYAETDAGHFFLRFTLKTYQFTDHEVASEAFDSYTDWVVRTSPFGNLCKGAVYRAQKGRWIYLLDVGCQVSQENYDHLVGELEVALQDVVADGGRAVQCYCGGNSVIRSID